MKCLLRVRVRTVCPNAYAYVASENQALTPKIRASLQAKVLVSRF